MASYILQVINSLLTRKLKKVLVAICALVFGSILVLVLQDQMHPSIQVTIVEEHHEVIPYWFQVAEQGLIPKQGNVLIHIDGHSDAAVPDYVPGYQPFKWPKSNKELTYLMQHNDEFIISAITTGYFKRFIWIWPSWNKKSFEYHHYIEHLGAVTLDTEEGPLTMVCSCLFDHHKEGKECTYSNYSVPDLNNAEITLSNPDDCKIEVNYEYQGIRDDLAFWKLQLGDWLNPMENVILDIDEDFYGCESGYNPMVEEGIEIDWIHNFDRILYKIFCPNSTLDEHGLHHILINNLDFMTRKCRWNKYQKCKQAFKESLVESFSINMYNQLKSGYKHTLCENSERQLQTQDYIKMFWEQVYELTRDQIRSLTKVGFCFARAPKSENFREQFRLCHGHNEPDSIYVKWYTPTLEDIDLRTQKLQSILESHSFPTPKAITICRSIRDGYLPRDHFEKIEASIIASISKAFKNVEVKYDSDLLGQAEGWPTRKLNLRK